MDSTRHQAESADSEPSASLPNPQDAATARKYTERDWEELKDDISRLYEDGTLKQVMDIMKRDHGLDATPKQYKSRIAKWGLNKHIQAHEMEGMIRIQQDRKQHSDKETEFLLRGRLVDQKKIDRYARDHPTEMRADGDEDMDMQSDFGPPETPVGLDYYTPANSRPGTPMEPPLLPEASSMSSLEANSQAPIFQPSPLEALQPERISGSQFQESSSGQQYPLEQPHNMYSQPNTSQEPSIIPSSHTGRRKALLIGINYFGQRGELRGCINDVTNMSAFLAEYFNYSRDDMMILTDDQHNPETHPTKENILRAMHWLVKDARPNDSLFLHFSGHGGQTRDLDGDEEDGYDEVIYPVDFQQAGHVSDDEMHRIMVMPLQSGTRLTAIFDSCHSGTALDLPYIYSTQGILKEPNLAKEAGQGLLGVLSNHVSNNIGGLAREITELFRKTTSSDEVFSTAIRTRAISDDEVPQATIATTTTSGDEPLQATIPIRTKTSSADVVMWSGSKDNQTSADAVIGTQSTGAMSWAFIKAMKKNPEQSYVQLLNSIRDELATTHTQTPQLSCSHPLNTNLMFVL